MTRFTIVLFEDGLQLVPSIWLAPNKKSCNWPPYTNDTKIKKAISNEEIPTNTWSMHKVLRLFGTSNSYESGMEKVKFAQEHSDIDYSDIEVEKNQRSRRNKTKENYSSSSDEQENLETTDIVTIAPPPLPSSFVNQPGSSSASSKILKPKSSQVSSVNSLAVTEVTFNKSDSCHKIHEEILRRLNQLFFKVKSIDDKLSDWEEMRSKPCDVSNVLTLEDIISLPVKTFETLELFEKDLENREFFKSMVTFLNKIGGKDSHDLTINILKRTVADELAKQYSWAGKLKKKAFKDLLLCKCIVQAVTLSQSNTEVEIQGYIAKWLVQANLRHHRNEAKKKKSTTDPKRSKQPEENLK
ncbi:PREDICTED: uncharacterized protein LOC108776249 [Cyphomyrmex costatus]|uniref:uncharacterized protein LOC108776249 n=1 Tax=Cyphomyrmex costatus TaxID=456900 RepID=UPI0008521D15|nr:PREDICTED: uncharacterized protein LOC108776249 [Cyphomyrmex costatus]